MIINRATFKFAALLILLVTSHVFAKPEWQQKTLKNGLQVIVIENHSGGSVYEPFLTASSTDTRGTE